MKKKYTKKQITEAIKYWKKQLYKMALNESQYSHEFEVKTMIELRKILQINHSQGLNCVIFESTNNNDINNVIKSFDTLGTLLIDSNTYQRADRTNGVVSTSLSEIMINSDKVKLNKMTYSMNTGFIIDGKSYLPVDCALMHTGDSSHMSDCYVIYRNAKRTNVIGIEIKNSIDGILFSASAIIDTNKLSDVMSQVSSKIMRLYRTHSDFKRFTLLNPYIIRSSNPDMPFSVDYFNKRKDHYKKSAREYLLNYVLPGVYDEIDNIDIRITKNGLTKAYTDVDSLNDIKRDNIKLLVNKLIYEIETACDTITDSKSEEFLYYCFGRLQGNTLETGWNKFVKNTFKLATYNVRIGKAGDVISNFYKNSSRIRTVEIDDNSIIKQHFMNNDADTYRPVMYIQAGQNFNYNLYKIDGQNDPLEFDKSSKFKPGDIDSIYFGINVEWGVRADNNRGNTVRYDAKIYPQLTKRQLIGSIVDKTHQVKSDIIIAPGWKDLMRKLGGQEMTGYTST